MALTLDIQTYNEEVQSATNVSGSTALDISESSLHHHTVTGSVEYSFNNASSDPAGNSFTLIIELDGEDYTVDWPSSVKWPKGVEGSILEGENGDIFVFNFISADGGSNWMGFISGEEVK